MKHKLINNIRSQLRTCLDNIKHCIFFKNMIKFMSTAKALETTCPNNQPTNQTKKSCLIINFYLQSKAENLRCCHIKNAARVEGKT